MKDKMADRHAINIAHADAPHVGDYWHEMFTPIARVMMVDANFVVVQKLNGCGGKEISDTDPAPELMPRAEFAKWVRYDTIPDKTWADVVPEHLKP